MKNFDLVPWRARYGLDWRYRLASGDLGTHSPFRQDPVIKEVSRYLQLKAYGGQYTQHAKVAFPQIAAAFSLQADFNKVTDLKIMTLGGLEVPEISERSGVPCDEILFWQQIFFQVDLAKDSPSWLARNTVFREVDYGNYDLAGRLHGALFGGPVVARSLLDGPGKIPEEPEAFLKMVMTKLRIQAFGYLLQPPQSKEEFEFRFELLTRLMLAEQKHALSLQQLAQKNEAAARRHEREQSRVQLAEERQQLAAKRQAEKQVEKAQATADKEAADKERRRRNAERRAEVAKQKEQALRERIGASPLAQLTWATSARSSPPSPPAEAKTAGCHKSSCTVAPENSSASPWRKESREPVSLPRMKSGSDRHAVQGVA
jgi:hypothetical protein